MKIITITDRTEGWDVDENEFETLWEKPFTGIYEEYSNGILIERTSLYKGLYRGFSATYYVENGNYWSLEYNQGIYIEWDKNGSVLRIEKRWSGHIIETMQIIGGERFTEIVMPFIEQENFLKNPMYSTKFCRQETINDLYDEAMIRLRNRTLFKDDWLYTEKGYYDISDTLKPRDE